MKTLSDNQREALIAEVKSVFADTPYPRIIGNLPNPSEFEDKKWDELSVNVVQSNHYLFLFDEEAFRYFLPGYLLIMLQNPTEMVDGFIIDGILRHLGQEYDELPKQDLCKLFNREQRDVVLKFLNLFEALWLSPNIEKQVLRIHPKRREWAKKELETIQRKSLSLLEKAIQYWQNCN